MKVRNGFVSNSSSSSFVAALNKDSRLHAEGMGEVYATFGFGYSFPLENDHYSRLEDYDTNKFVVVVDYECGTVGIVRPLSRMRGDQTLDDFVAKTKKLFIEEFSDVYKPRKKPELMAIGDVGNGG